MLDEVKSYGSALHLATAAKLWHNECDRAGRDNVNAQYCLPHVRESDVSLVTAKRKRPFWSVVSKLNGGGRRAVGRQQRDLPRQVVKVSVALGRHGGHT